MPYISYLGFCSISRGMGFVEKFAEFLNSREEKQVLRLLIPSQPLFFCFDLIKKKEPK